MLLGMSWSTVVLVRSPPPLWVGLACAVFTLVATDLVSGLLHVVLDNPRSLSLGPIRGLAEGFQRHHERPSKIYEMPLYEHLYVMHMPLSLLFLVLLPFGNSAMHAAFLSMAVGLHLMQMAHLWAHVPPAQVPRAVRGLQSAGLLLDKPQHDAHHTAPFDRNFCIMTGWFNGPLNHWVERAGATSHGWLGAFLLVALSPLVLAYFLNQ